MRRQKMTPRSEDVGLLQTHVRQLRYAVATTSCRKTAEILQKMLDDAETSLRSAAERRNAPNSKQH